MRTIFVYVLFALLLGVGVVALIETDPGYVLVSYGNYTLEASLWVGLLLVGLLLLLAYALFRMIYSLVSGQRSFTNWLGSRKAHLAARHSTSGLIHFIEGNWDKARRELVRGAQKNDAPLFNYLLAARSSHHLQEPDKMHEFLRAAGESESAAAVAVEITLAEMKLQAGEYEQAEASLVQAREDVGKHPYVLNLLCQAYQGSGDWDKLFQLLPDIKKYKQLPDEEFQRLEQQVYTHRLAQSAADTSTAAVNLPNIWKKIPTRLKHDAQIFNTYVSLLIGSGASDAAEKIIVRTVKQEWNPTMVRQYGLMTGGDAHRQLAQAERWLKAHPEDPQLLLCLGRLSARSELWGKARDYFESSYRVEHSAQVCAELGRLLTSLGEPTAAAAYFQEGLLMCEPDLSQLPMPDKVASHDGQIASS
jgi:HemY protein